VLTVVGPAEEGGPAASFGLPDWRRLGRTLAVLLNQAATTTDQLELVRRTYLGTGGGRRDVGPGELPEYARTAGAVTAAAGRVLSAVLPPAPRAAAPPAVGDA
jgi:hypothetical protein